MEPQTTARPRQHTLNGERADFERRISALNEEEDPLEVFVQYTQWIITNYGEKNESSGLTQLLKQGTEAFKSDTFYANDIRYLKLWVLYAHQLDDTTALKVFTYLSRKDIGTSHSLMFEEMANAYEKCGKLTEAKAVYEAGLKRTTRPTGRLKARFVEFQKRITALKSKPAPAPAAGFASTAASRYAMMLAPPPPGKRPEKLMFDMSLLYTVEGGEFCIQEARARSQGLLGKKWPPVPVPLPAPQHSAMSSSSQVADDGLKGSRAFAHRRKSVMGAEPTVTINTKEALADVFEFYNSPEKTRKFNNVKLKTVNAMTPVATPRLIPQTQQNNENAMKTPTPAFRPFVDDPSSTTHKENKAAPKLIPFVDPDVQKTPAAAPRPILALRESSENSDSNVVKPIISKVFTPAQTKLPPLAPLRDVFTDDHGKPQPKPKPMLHERAKSQHDVLAASDVRTPFKVFSRPGENPEATPRAIQTPSFKPFVDSTPLPVLQREERVYSPPQAEDINVPKEPTWDDNVIEIDDDDSLLAESEEEEYEEGPEQYDDDYDDSPVEYQAPLAPERSQFDDDEHYGEAPLGGRFGQFNVMTPITERTFEYTSRSAFGTPSQHHLRKLSEGDEEASTTYGTLLEQGDHSSDEGDDEPHPIRPLVFSAELSTSSAKLEDQTGQLSLADALALSTSFKPANPCNPFEASVLNVLLSCLPRDGSYYDLRSQDARHLAGLQKFSKRGRKNSGGGDAVTTYTLLLNGHKYQVTAKLGEGGFGAVFEARDCGMGSQDEDTDDEDDLEDEEEASMVAVKVVTPRNIWEYHVLRRLHSVLPSSLQRSVVLPHALYAFRDESYLIMDLCPQGPLLDVVNKATSAGISQQGGCLDELLVVFFTIELLRLLETMHTAGIIHGDLKIDNCLLRLENIPGGASNWSGMYSPSGDGGWAYKGLKVIDFGRTIDTRLFPSGQKFMADWDTDERDCVEARENRPWTFQTDYYGMAGIAYCMLFGKYMQINSVTLQPTATGEQRYKVATPFKRYWQTEMWTNLFDVLLNPCHVRRDGQLPVSNELGNIRMEMEEWLVANCSRTSGTLKGLLKKVELSCLR